MDRESIYSKVFATIASAANFKTASRRLKHWADVDSKKQPALFMAQAGETIERRKGLPSKYTFMVKLYLYAKAANATDPVDPIINLLVDAVTNLIESKANPNNPTGPRLPLLPGETNNLGVSGVSHCWIEGNIETDEGALDGQAVVIIPVNILVT